MWFLSMIVSRQNTIVVFQLSKSKELLRSTQLCVKFDCKDKDSCQEGQDPLQGEQRKKFHKTRAPKDGNPWDTLSSL